MLQFLTPQEAIAVAYGGASSVPPPPPTQKQHDYSGYVVPRSYTVNATSTRFGSTTTTHGTITPTPSNYDGVVAFQRGMSQLQNSMAAYAQGKAVQRAQGMREDETMLNNRYLRKTSIPPSANYMGMALFMPATYQTDGVKLTVCTDKKLCGVLRFKSAPTSRRGNRTKRTKHRR